MSNMRLKPKKAKHGKGGPPPGAVKLSKFEVFKGKLVNVLEQNIGNRMTVEMCNGLLNSILAVAVSSGLITKEELQEKKAIPEKKEGDPENADQHNNPATNNPPAD